MHSQISDENLYINNYNKGNLHPKNKIQKDKLLNSSHWLCMERAKIYTDTYRENEGENPSILAALALKNTFKQMTINIDSEELLVGNRSSQHIAPPFAPEKGDFTFIFLYLLKDLKKLGYQISEEDEKTLFNYIIPFWKGKTVRDYKVKKFEEKGLSSKLNLSLKEIRKKLKAFGVSSLLKLILEDEKIDQTKLQRRIEIFKTILRIPALFGGIKGGSADNVKGRGRCIDTQAHIVLGYKNILKYGFKGIKKQAMERLETAEIKSEKEFLESIAVICDTMKDFSDRFSRLAKSKAQNENNNRKKELLEIAQICENVPWLPPKSFYEAVQAIWFTQNAAIISYGAGSGITPGRVDQLLFPYYKKDIEENNINKEKISRILEEFIIKINNNVVIWPGIAGVRLNHLGADIENITIGGVDKNGMDATNDLSFLFIEAIKNTNLATSASFRFSNNSSEKYINEIFNLHKYTNSPALFNDEIIIKAMEKDGYSIEDAREYCIVGCVEPSGNGNTFGATGGSKLYFPSILDLVFNRGKTTFFGNQDTIDTGDPVNFKDFNEFKKVFYIQLQEIVDCIAEATHFRDEIWANRFHNPLISCTIDGCIKNAKDMTEGGAHYKFQAIGAGGLGTAVDSLAAIKKFVFEDKTIKMKDLIKGIQTNFKNNEKLRKILQNGPKFGNDDDYVDSIAVELVDKFCDMVVKKKLPGGGHFKPSFISYGLNIYEGTLEPATPNGRKAGEPLSNSISPCNGSEKNGPTAAFNSLSKIDHTKIGYGDSLNMRFPNYLLQSDKDIDILKSLILTYFKKGGFHVQINTMGTVILKDAQIRPEKYEDLIVRVSGYSAYYTRLGKKIQDDIIDRIEFTN